MPATVIGAYAIGSLIGPSTLNDGIIAFWKLEEASGTRVDEVGNNDLSDNNTVTQQTGKVGNCAQFTNANHESLSIIDNTDLSTGDIDFTFCCWLYINSPGDTAISKYNFSASQREYLLWQPGVQMQWLVSNNGSAEISVTATSFGNVPNNTWIFVVAWHDATANTINIQVNDGTVDSFSHTTGVLDGSSQFMIGGIDNYASLEFDGRIDAVGFWKRVLTAGERTELYNGGTGKEYPF